MAFIFESWVPDGNGQSVHKSMRSDAKGYSHEGRDAWIAQQKADKAVCLITKNRTDRQSHIEHVIYTSPGYVDPCL